MRCEDIERLLNEHADADLTPVERQAVEAHVASCDSCGNAWLAARVLRKYRSLPTPMPSPTLIAKLAVTRQPPAAMKRTSLWSAAIGGALAASFVAVTFNYYRASPADSARTVPSLTMSLHESRDVNVAIDSPEAFTEVEVRVVLAGGIELEGLAGRRELKWKTDLEAGMNRLTLPIVASDRTGGKVLVSVAYGTQQQAFVVQIDVADGRDANTEI
jgi:hypothetical protein